MKNYQEILAEICRIDIEESTGRVFLIFEVKSPKFKEEVKKNWTQDIEYKIIDKKLVLNDE